MRRTNKVVPLYRQGDVYFIPAPATSGQRKPNSSFVLAEGEVTGHKHQVALEDRSGCGLYSIGDQMFLSVTESGGVRIHHEEHKELTLPPGGYEVRIQREYTPEEIRNVVD